jgi:hypothetical protein
MLGVANPITAEALQSKVCSPHGAVNRGERDPRRLMSLRTRSPSVTGIAIFA